MARRVSALSRQILLEERDHGPCKAELRNDFASHKQACDRETNAPIRELVTGVSLYFEANPLPLGCPAQVDACQPQAGASRHRQATLGHIVGNLTRLDARKAVTVVNGVREHAGRKNLLVYHVDTVIDPWHPALELSGTPPEIRHPALVFLAQPVDDAPLTADRLVNDLSMRQS
jgi:hypothetical protein